MRCRHCQNDPSLKLVWGCDWPTQVAVWVHEDGEEFFNCPLNFISENVQDWYEEYNYNQEFKSSTLPYTRQSSKFIQAIRFYNVERERYHKEPGKESNNRGLNLLMASAAQRKEQNA